MKKIDLMWLVGLLEGEGCFTYIRDQRNGKDRRYPRIDLQMNDRDVVKKVHVIAGVGNFAIARRGGKKAGYRWCCTTAQARSLMKKLLPHMGKRRSRRIKQLLSGKLIPLQKRVAI